MNSFAKHKAEVAKQQLWWIRNDSTFMVLDGSGEVRQGAENALWPAENATFFCKINDIEPGKIPADLAHLQNILGVIFAS